ncbi:ribosome biogenesis GTPase YlqF [Ferrimonas marina]|uniref:Ribosome biogenesis GTPase A n=1 Tax=Ferrimonas marina TaxID=299255 RepID=A0A1M5Z3L9_9GAMM|nr:ribosome biogenesis GTPase YlqF [Ferrimonas marina]SHI18799.1 ribosome biogenesis GTPase A [Ferrimonas marina]
MALQWFPGHMNKARREIKEVMPQMDVIIEVLDARVPFSSENPMVAKLRGDKPVIKILNKADLADAEMTESWMSYLEQEQGVKTLAFDQDKASQVHKIVELCHKMVPNKVGQDKQIKAMIMGIPNVGKSTLINTLAKRVVAKTGNEPAVTKAQQRIKLEQGIMLYDTPGMLWPKLENEHYGYRLAAIAAIRDTVVDYEDLGSYVSEYLMQAYPDRLMERYKLDALPEEDWQFMEAAGRKRGCVRSGNQVDYAKFGSLLINELRSGILGGITLETPEMRDKEMAELEIARAKAEAEKAAKLEQKNKGSRKR